MNIEALTKPARQRVDQALSARLQAVSLHRPLAEAMRYGALLGGKRIRPYLTLTIAEICNGSSELAVNAACAVECIHAYSLIHDDLPAMDDDNLRRGQPTCHIQFDEATAILAGDALQALAFELISQPTEAITPAARQLAMVSVLAAASGGNGMCGGQALDLAATHQSLSESQLQQVHLHKTGALIQASAELGVMCGDDDAQQYQAAFAAFAQQLGLAFQIQDDILDVTASTAILG